MKRAHPRSPTETCNPNILSSTRRPKAFTQRPSVYAETWGRRTEAANLFQCVEMSRRVSFTHLNTAHSRFKRGEKTMLVIFRSSLYMHCIGRFQPGAFSTPITDTNITSCPPVRWHSHFAKKFSAAFSLHPFYPLAKTPTKQPNRLNVLQVVVKNCVWLLVILCQSI